MLVTDRVEWHYVSSAIIDTSACRLSAEPCGPTLNSRERSGSVYDKKPTYIYSRARQKVPHHPWIGFLMHYSCSGRCILC